MLMSAHLLSDLFRRPPLEPELGESPPLEPELGESPPLEPELGESPPLEPELEFPPAGWMQVDEKHVSAMGSLEPDQILDSAPTNQ